VFDVASIKPGDPSVASGGFHRLDAGVMEISGMTMRELIANAYYLNRDYQIVDPGKLLGSRRYDIYAKDSSVHAVGSKSPEWGTAISANYPKLRALLADRFQLKVHIETRQMPMYALIVAKREMIQSVNCGTDGYRLESGLAKGPMKITSLVAVLAKDMNLPTVDDTHLEGCYDIDMKWTVDPDNVELPPINTALRDVGLKLEPRKGPVDVLVVDHVESPSAN
jgi:uncharacterized protein (TIGR03435 family)